MKTAPLPLFGAIASAALLLASPTFATEALKEPGVLLREGNWDGDVGTYNIPNALVDVKPKAWPLAGWVRLRLRATEIEIVPVVTPPKGKPSFLESIVSQVERAHDGTKPVEAAPDALTRTHQDEMFLRVPGTSIKAANAPSYRFKNGTSHLLPKLDYRYELMLGTQAFAFTVQNDARGKNGAPYGEGANYTIEYDGQTYSYALGGYGWNSSIRAIADIDGDGKPDFIIAVGGSNQGYEAVLLPSVARPGKNPATASLGSTGC